MSTTDSVQQAQELQPAFEEQAREEQAREEPGQRPRDEVKARLTQHSPSRWRCGPEQLAWRLRVKRTHAELVRFHNAIGAPEARMAANLRLQASSERGDFFEYYENRPRQARQSLGQTQDIRRLLFTVTTADGTITEPDAIIALAATDTEHDLAWAMANQSVLAPLTAELQTWANVDMSIAVCALPGSITFNLQLTPPVRLSVGAHFAISTVKGKDEEQLVLGTLHACLDINIADRTVRQEVTAAESARCTDAQLYEAAAAIAERQMMLNLHIYRRDVARARIVMRILATLVFLAVGAAVLVSALGFHQRYR